MIKRLKYSDFRLTVFAAALFLFGTCILCCLPEPSYALDELYESRLDKGFLSTEPYSYLLMENARTDKVREKELLESAKKYSPDLPAVYFALAKASIPSSTRGIYQSLEHFRQGMKAYSRNFWWRFSAAGLLYTSLLISFVASMLIILIIRFPIEAGLFSHDAIEDKRRWGLLAVLIFLSLLGPVAFIAGAFFIIGLYFKRWNKSVVYLSFLFLLLSSLLQSETGIFLSAPPPKLKAVVGVNESRDNGYALWSLKDRPDFPDAFSYALALKREGHYNEAIDIYKKLASPPNKPDPRVHINLGNAYYGIKDLEAANASYKNSIAITPLPSAYYNLSQVHREMLDFVRGDEYFTSAAKLSPDAVSRFSSIMSGNPNRFVVDETLPMSLIWENAFKRSGSFSGILLLTTGIGIIMIPLFHSLDRRVKHRARSCIKCGTTFCGKCSKAISWKEICPLCYRSLIRIDTVDSRERVARLLMTYQSQDRRRKTAKLLSYMIPGAGQIYSGRILSGLFFLWPCSFALISLLMSRLLSFGLSSFSHIWLIPVAALIICLTYALSILHMIKGIRKGWL